MSTYCCICKNRCIDEFCNPCTYIWIEILSISSKKLSGEIPIDYLFNKITVERRNTNF